MQLGFDFDSSSGFYVDIFCFAFSEEKICSRKITEFRHNKGTIAALKLMTKLKSDACRIASGTAG